MLTCVDSTWELKTLENPFSLELLDSTRRKPSDKERCLRRVEKAIYWSTKSGSLCLSTKKLQRIQHNERIRLTFNRIVRNDLRRVFPSMYYNVLNLADSKLTEEFLCRYFSPDCEVLSYFLSQLKHCEREGAAAGGGARSTCIQCRGPLELARQIARSAIPFSDYVFLSMNSRIIRRLEASHFSVIEVDSDFKATALPSQPSSSAALQLGERGFSYDNLHSMTTNNCSFGPVTVDAKVKFFFHMNSEGFIVKSVSYLI